MQYKFFILCQRKPSIQWQKGILLLAEFCLLSLLWHFSCCYAVTAASSLSSTLLLKFSTEKNQLLFFNKCGNQYHHVIKQFILNKANLCQDKSKQNYNLEE